MVKGKDSTLTKMTIKELKFGKTECEWYAQRRANGVLVRDTELISTATCFAEVLKEVKRTHR